MSKKIANQAGYALLMTSHGVRRWQKTGGDEPGRASDAGSVSGDFAPSDAEEQDSAIKPLDEGDAEVVGDWDADELSETLGLADIERQYGSLISYEIHSHMYVPFDPKEAIGDYPGEYPMSPPPPPSYNPRYRSIDERISFAEMAEVCREEINRGGLRGIYIRLHLGQVDGIKHMSHAIGRHNLRCLDKKFPRISFIRGYDDMHVSLPLEDMDNDEDGVYTARLIEKIRTLCEEISATHGDTILLDHKGEDLTSQKERCDAVWERAKRDRDDIRARIDDEREQIAKDTIRRCAPYSWSLFRRVVGYRGIREYIQHTVSDYLPHPRTEDVVDTYLLLDDDNAGVEEFLTAYNEENVKWRQSREDLARDEAGRAFYDWMRYIDRKKKPPKIK